MIPEFTPVALPKRAGRIEQLRYHMTQDALDRGWEPAAAKAWAADLAPRVVEQVEAALGVLAHGPISTEDVRDATHLSGYGLAFCLPSESGCWDHVATFGPDGSDRPVPERCRRISDSARLLSEAERLPEAVLVTTVQPWWQGPDLGMALRGAP